VAGEGKARVQKTKYYLTRKAHGVLEDLGVTATNEHRMYRDRSQLSRFVSSHENPWLPSP